MYIRPATAADAEALGRVHVESWRTTYPGIVPEVVFARLDPAISAARWQQRFADPAYPKGAFVVENAVGRVVGFADGGPERDGIPGYAGELYALYLLREAQGQGAGRALVRAVAAWLAAREITTMLVWALAGNTNACRFYAHLGGQFITTKPYHIAGATLEETAYGWTDTGPLQNVETLGDPHLRPLPRHTGEG